MARKKITPEEEVVTTACEEETAPEGLPVDTAPPVEGGADTGDFPAELPDAAFPTAEATEPAEELPAVEETETWTEAHSTAEETAVQNGDAETPTEAGSEVHEETSEFPNVDEPFPAVEAPATHRISVSEEADWGFREPVAEETAAEPLKETAPEDSEGTSDDAGGKNERTLFYELDFNELDRELSAEERQEWNSIYASYRGHSAISGTIIGQSTCRGRKRRHLRIKRSSAPLSCRTAFPF